MTVRLPPHNAEVERFVLGALLRKGSLFPVVAGILEESDFFLFPSRIIFQSMSELHADNVEIDVSTVGAKIIQDNNIEKIGGAVYLSELLDCVATTTNVEHFATTVRDLSRRRTMLIAAHGIVQDGYDLSIDTEDYLAGARESVSDASKCPDDAGPVLVKECVQGAYEDAISMESPVGVVKTGIGILDKLIGGLWPGVLSVMAARPSMGKSCLALNIATNAAMGGKKVLVISLEDPRRFILWRIMARLGRVDSDKILRHQTNSEDKNNLIKAREILSCLPLYIDDRSALSADQIRHTAMAHKDRHGLDLLIIDLLTNVKQQGRDLYEGTTKNCQTINTIPRDLEIPTLLVHQLNRGVESRPDRNPTLADLRQSGEIEQLARLVLFLMRPAYYPDRYPEADEHELLVYVAKNTHGRTGRMKLFCDLKYMTINDGNTPEPSDARDGY